MTTKNILYKILLTMTAAVMFVGCSEFEDTETESPVYTTGTQAYISNETATDLVYTPALTQSFDVTFGRGNVTEAATFSIAVTDADNVFTVPATVAFAAGETSTDVTITFDLAIGNSGVLTLEVPEADANPYGMDSITISVNRDYTWMSAGVVSFTSDWAGATADLDLETTKEDPNLYRILSPYYVLEPDYCPAPGYHIQFMLDDNHNAVSVTTSNIGEEASAGGNWWLHWDPINYAANCTFTNDSSSYVINGLWSSGVDADNLTATYVAVESFIWSDGYPE